MNFQSPNPALESLFAWAWKTSLSATALIALVVLAQVLLRRVLSPRWRYALGLLILLRLTLPFAPASSLSIFNLGKRAAQPAANTPGMVEAALLESSLQTVPDQKHAEAWTPTQKAAQDLTTSRVHAWKNPIMVRSMAGYVWLGGCLGMLGLVFYQHRKFVHELGRWERVREPRVLGMLAECRAMLGVKRDVAVLAADSLNTPALFGVFQPRLLIPREMLQRLEEGELRHVFLHELVHLQRGDLSINWAMILVRSLHWFNPAVWLAMKRLRADQELACDAAVISRLAADERRRYGGTLIKLLADFSATDLGPGLVPFVTNKQTIKRRITMIANFKPAGRLGMAASLALLAALACVTFTRAADKPNEPVQAPRPIRSADKADTADKPPEASVVVDVAKDGTYHLGPGTKPVTVEELKRVLVAEVGSNAGVRVLIRADKAADYQAVMRALDVMQQAKVRNVSLATVPPAAEVEGPRGARGAGNPALTQWWADEKQKIANEEAVALRQQLDQVDVEILALQKAVQQNPDPNDAVAEAALSPDDVQSVQRIKQSIQNSEDQRLKNEMVLHQLKKLKAGELRQVLPTTIPDAILAQSLQDLNAVEAKLATLTATLGRNNPDVMAAGQTAEKLNAQIDARAQGILKGLEIQVEADRAVTDSLTERINNLRNRPKTDAQRAEYDKFIKLKAELQALEEQRDKLSKELRMREDRASTAKQALDEARMKYPPNSAFLEPYRQRYNDALNNP